MILLGLTGSIGMGKSTTAKMFAAQGAAVYDADAAVHKLYREKAVPLIAKAFDGVVHNGIVDRAALGKIVLSNVSEMKRLEEIVHPLVHEEERLFIERALEQRRRVAVLDIPLLFETKAEKRVQAVVVVTASEAVQRQRVLAREGMNEEKFLSIVSKQMSDAEKRRKAHFLIDTGRGLEAAEASVASILKAVSAIS
ncbi:dephospho-CoA kinase [Flexibacterium corallicola]|uniref:dephospho-CoA kinase n=1 Tax=Flexibacterium corallicola TaxID=3037259 RepID=UPI00286F5448|nr:dephospho-CoA kinase [Pseudovibrio sp. M1P-2-3]